MEELKEKNRKRKLVNKIGKVLKGIFKNVSSLKNINFKKLKPKNIAILIITIMVIFSLFTLFFKDEKKVELTGKITHGTLSSAISGSGITKPVEFQAALVASSADILSVDVAPGDAVEEGQLLYTQDDSEIDENIEGYEDEISNLSDSLADYIEDRDELRSTLDGCNMRAPFSGKVLDITAKENDNVQSGKVLATLVDDKIVTASTYFGYEYKNDIYVGMNASISIAEQMMKLDGKVTEIKYVDYITSTGKSCFLVTVEANNLGGLSENMIASCMIGSGDETIYPEIESKLEFLNSEKITSEVSAELTSVNVSNYERVNKGDLLFTLDSEKVISQINTLDTKIELAEKRIEEYNEKILDAEEKREEFKVHAEISGKVIAVGVDTAKTVRSGGMAVSIYNMDTMQIEVNIDELDIENVKNGMEAMISYSSGNSKKEYKGIVTEVSYEATNENGVAYFPITIEIDSKGELSAGVNVDYTLSTGDNKEGTLVPVSAIKTTEKGSCVFLKSDSNYKKTIKLDGDIVPKGYVAASVKVLSTNSQYALIEEKIEENTEVFLRYIENAPSGKGSVNPNEDEKAQFSDRQNMKQNMGNFNGGMNSGMGSVRNFNKQ